MQLIRLGPKKRAIAVVRFRNDKLRSELAAQRIETVACDLFEAGVFDSLPDVPNVIFMAARKFGTDGAVNVSCFVTAGTSLQAPMNDSFHALNVLFDSVTD